MEKKYYKEWKNNLTNNVSFYEGYPIPSFIELNISPTCNRKCEFCPRAHGWEDSGDYLSLDKVLQLKRDLKSIGFGGMIGVCGFGEPLQHPKVIEVLETLKSEDWIVELVTNGDFLTREIAEVPDHVAVSMYDGAHQIEKFTQMLSGLSFSLRERWELFDTLTNRSGYVNYGNEVDVTKPCNYPLYYMFINHNGESYLCPQDWSRKYVLGNVFSDKLLKVWQSNLYLKYRKQLLNNRDIDPCRDCNTCGVAYGNHYQIPWKDFLKYDKH